MDERVTTRAEFDEMVWRLATALGEAVWAQVVEQGLTAAADGWLRAQGGAMLRGVLGSAEKIERLVAQEGQRAEQMLQASPSREPVAPRAAARGPCYVGIDGGMIFVEGRWQEVKLGCIYQARDRVTVSGGRSELIARQVVAVRGEPAALGARLWPRAKAAGIDEREEVVVLGDGAPGNWNV